MTHLNRVPWLFATALSAALLCSACVAAMRAAQGAPPVNAPSAPAPVSAAQRLQKAAAVSRDLYDHANILTVAAIKKLALNQDVPDDRANLNKARFPHPADLPAYLQARPWSIAYAYDPGEFFATHKFPTPAWPTPDDAQALRTLLADKDAAIRSLAAEALATLGFPEDAARIAVLLDDTAEAAPVLGEANTMLAQGFPRNGDPGGTIVYDRSYYPRTVQTYAREAMNYLTGMRFDGNDRGTDGRSLPPQTFQEWAKNHDLGKESFWYWQKRLSHQHPFWMSSQPIESPFHKQYVTEIHALNPEAEAKIFLLGGAFNAGLPVENPFGPNFVPEDIKLRISRERLLELLALKNLWPDVAMTDRLRDRLRVRIAYLAPTLLPKEDWPLVRQAVGTLQSTYPPDIFISRLLPAGGAADLNNVDTREGFLQHALAVEKETYRSEDVMREMLRTNAQVHLAAIERAFYAETQSSALPTFRATLLTECGTEPHTPVKSALLLRLVNDPRNNDLFTRRSTSFDSDSYRKAAARSVNAVAGKTLIPDSLVEELVTKSEALAEFRRLANSLDNSSATKPTN